MIPFVDVDADRRVLLVKIPELRIEQLIDLGQRDLVLRALGAGKAGHDLAHFEFQRLGEDRLVIGFEPKALFLAVGFDQRDLIVRSTGQAQVFDGFLVDAEQAAGGAVFRRHVGDRGAVGEAQV